MTAALLADPLTPVLFALLLGLLVGSFLNVVISRLPVMLETAWRGDCREFLELPAEPPPERFNLVVPRSRCPSCGHLITALENIPVVSYLVQKGRCRGCGTDISLQYPLVEIVTALLSAAVAWRFGFSIATALALILTWSLIALSAIDWRQQLLPDVIVLPLMWLGLLISPWQIFTDMQASLFGAAAGYLSLWMVYWIFKLLTGKEGMGYGDFKLLAALGAWLGWQSLPMVVLLSSALGAIVGIALMAAKRLERGKPMPFGPWLALGGWCALIWNQQLNGFLYGF